MTSDELWRHQEALLLLGFALDSLRLVSCSLERPELTLAIRLIARAHQKEMEIVTSNKNGSPE